jgi:hypothetical protein
VQPCAPTLRTCLTGGGIGLVTVLILMLKSGRAVDVLVWNRQVTGVQRTEEQSSHPVTHAAGSTWGAVRVWGAGLAVLQAGLPCNLAICLCPTGLGPQRH